MCLLHVSSWNQDPSCPAKDSDRQSQRMQGMQFSPLPLLTPRSPFLSLSVGVKSAYSPAPSTVYSQPPPPQRQVTALKPLAPSSSVSTSYNIYPVSTSVQQPPTPISSYTLGSSFGSTVSATTYSGNIRHKIEKCFLSRPTQLQYKTDVCVSELYLLPHCTCTQDHANMLASQRHARHISIHTIDTFV